MKNMYDSLYDSSIPGTSPQWATATSDIEVETVQGHAVWNGGATVSETW